MGIQNYYLVKINGDDYFTNKINSNQTFNNIKNNYSSLNKILQSNLNMYKKNYSLEEIINIFLYLRDYFRTVPIIMISLLVLGPMIIKSLFSMGLQSHYQNICPTMLMQLFMFLKPQIYKRSWL